MELTSRAAGDVWFVLRDFSAVLSAIRNTVEKMLKLASGADEEDEDEDESEAVEVADTVGDDRTTSAGTDDPGSVTPGAMVRPSSVTDADWAFYRLIVAAQTSFDEKFKKVREVACRAQGQSDVWRFSRRGPDRGRPRSSPVQRTWSSA